jgi:hypothetical protein
MQTNLSDHRRRKERKKERKKEKKKKKKKKKKEKRNNEIKVIFRILKCIKYNKMDELVLLY